ncbi:MAG: cell division protein SepF [Syntrophomonadaceae bacterium]|jgi:cell division inhibitor SepF
MGFLDKICGLLGWEHEEVREEVIEVPDNTVENPKGIANVVSIHTNKNMKVVICEPESFDEVQTLAEHLKSRKQVILNFENTAPEISQRVIDFISGTVYSLGGNSQQLGKSIFLFTPSNIEIAQDHRSIMRKHGFKDPFGGER